MKTLLIDDDEFALKLLSIVLRDLGFDQITQYTRARDALTQLEESADEATLIFCDLQMPDMDGVEFVHHLNRIGYAGGLVLVSGHDSRVLQTGCRLAQAHKLHVLGAVHKPASPVKLKQLLGSQIGRADFAARAPRKTYSAADLRHAIENNELCNHYQPKVATDTARLIGVECLARWHHPEDGLVYPDQFIPLAEAHGLIDALTRVVLRGALHQTRRWQDSGLDVSMAVNVSMASLTALEFPEFVADSLAEARLPPASLILEVTESRLMNDPLSSVNVLIRMRLKGIGLSIDDFGTGHSSLAQLRDVPFDELKVDRSFVHGASRDGSQRAILEASLGMARQLKMKTVAEGVEDRDDWDLMRKLHCDVAQGYFIARPMAGEQLIDWVAQWDQRCRALALTL